MHDETDPSRPAGASAPASPFDELRDEIYAELRRLAAAYMRHERPDHTLQPTALVHEAFLRLSAQREWIEEDPLRFKAVAARMIERILVDHARKKKAQCRDAEHVPLETDSAVGGEILPDVLALHESLEALERRKPRLAEVVRLRYFAGLTIDETARAIGIAPRQVDADWSFARAWLARELERGAGPA
jgi:RNA polymerase sigma factor (TIGR02999 family)